MTGRAGTDASTRMIDVDAVRQRDIQDAAGQPGTSVGDLLGIDLYRDIHRQKRDGELLRRGRRHFLRHIGIRSTHANYYSAARRAMPTGVS